MPAKNKISKKASSGQKGKGLIDILRSLAKKNIPQKKNPRRRKK